MHKFLILLLIGGVTVFAQDPARMNEVAKAQTEGDRFMGTVLVAKDDAVIFKQGYGSANLELKVPNTTNTKFRIGSVTKQFTAAAILVLEERGKLKTEDPVSKYLPNSPKAWEQVTIHHLLTHTSGIPSFTSFPEYATWKLSPNGAAKTVELFRERPLEFAPGEKFAYSNSGYVLLGHLVELVSGQSYEEFLRANILSPLGMNDTGFDSNTALIPQRASGYVPGPKGLTNAPYIDMHVPHGAGSLYSTVEDLHRWTQGLFGGKLLSPASLDKMTKPEKDNYACGLFVHTNEGRKIVDHGGGIEGFNAQLTYYPESKTTVVVLANVNGSAPGELASQLAMIAFGGTVKLASERKEIEVPVSILKTYVGVYQLAPQATNTIRLTDGKLTTQLSGQAAYPIFPESDKKFFLKIVDAQMEFCTDDKGRVTHLLQYQNGRTQKAPRISDTVVERKAISVSPAILQTYVGTYTLAPNFDLVISLEGDQLMSQATGQGKLPLFAEAENKFFLKVVDAQIEFFKDAKGAVTHLVLHQGGRDVKAPRKE